MKRTHFFNPPKICRVFDYTGPDDINETDVEVVVALAIPTDKILEAACPYPCLAHDGRCRGERFMKPSVANLLKSHNVKIVDECDASLHEDFYHPYDDEYYILEFSSKSDAMMASLLL